MQLSRDDLQTWVRLAIDAADDTASGLARKAGLATTTLTRFLNDPDAPLLGLRSIAKIAHAAGLPPPIGTAQIVPARGLAEAEAQPYVRTSSTPLQAAIDALIAGRNAADPWTLRSRALELRGYREGDILIVDLNRRPETGDVVCAQIYDWQRGVAETVFRIYEAPYLIAACSDFQLAEKLRRPHVVDNDRVIIKGVVTESVRARVG